MTRALLVLLLLGTSTLITSCKAKDSAPAAAAGGKGKGGRQALIFAVDVISVEAKKVDYLVTAPGTIDAFERVQVTARVAGVVDRVAFTEGQQVKKGKVLVNIDGERYGLLVASAKAQLDKAKASQQDADAMVARREATTTDHPGLITGEELATYKTKSLTAKADQEVAAQDVKSAQVNLRDSAVVAPMEGIIQTRTVETGQYVQAGYVMATILRNDPMLLHFQVEPNDAPRLQPGMTASFSLRETQRTYTAKLTLVSGAADSTTHMVSVTGEVQEDTHKFWLRPGSFCDVTINLGSQRDAPMIPRSAARATDHGYVAYVINGDTTVEKLLSLGMSTKDGWIEVKSGLAAGDMLVVRGAEPLSNGAKVKATKVDPNSLNTTELGAPAASAIAASTDSAPPPPVPSAPPPAGDSATANAVRPPKAPGSGGKK